RTDLDDRSDRTRRNPRQSLRSRPDPPFVAVHHSLQETFYPEPAAFAAAASLRLGAALPNESRHRSVHREQRPLGLAKRHAALLGRIDRRNAHGVCPVLLFYAGGAALSRRFARGDFFPCAEAADEL